MLRKLLNAAAPVLLATGLALTGAAIANAETPLGAHADGLRYQAEARAYGWRSKVVHSGETAVGIRAEGLRYQAEARAYGWRPQVVHPGETAAGIRADGLRYQAEARVYRLQTAGSSNSGLAYGLIAPGAALTAVGLFLLFRNRRKNKEASFVVPAGSES